MTPQDIMARLRARVLRDKAECALLAPLRRVAGGATDYTTIHRAFDLWTLRDWLR